MYVCIEKPPQLIFHSPPSKVPHVVQRELRRGDALRRQNGFGVDVPPFELFGEVVGNAG